MTFNKSDFFHDGNLLKPRFNPEDRHNRIDQTFRKDIGKKRDGPAKAGPPPVIEDAEGARQDTADMLRRRKGRAASILTSGNAGAPMTASKTLLGG